MLCCIHITPWALLNTVLVVSLPTDIVEVRSTTVTVNSQPPSVSPVLDQIDAMDLSILSGEEVAQFRALLRRYQSVFSAYEGDLGCTKLIAHKIPV